jgi:NADH dehydrogenase [ubiquinone] 1 alpha subcomplex assembly factor 6
MSSDHMQAVEALVKSVDYDRYLAALLVTPQARPHLFALYAFNYEVAKTAENVSQPVMGQIRLQWWRDAIEEIYAGSERRHEVVQALAEAIRAQALPRALFDALIDARESDFDEAPFADWTSLQAYADATSGNLMRLAARILGAGTGLDEAAGEAGIAYALAGLLRALPFHAAQRRLMLPAEAVRAVSLSKEQIFSGITDDKVSSLFASVATRARDHLRRARDLRVRRAFLPALLPAALVGVYLKRVTRPGFNPFRDSTEVAVYQRPLAMLGAMLRGSL